MVIAGTNFPELNESIIRQHKLNKLEFIGFIDDNYLEKPKEISKFPILGGWDILNQLDCNVVNSVAKSCQARCDAIKRLESLGARLTGVRCLDILSDSASVSKTSIILADSRIGSNAKISNHAVIHQGVHIGHDVQVGEFCFLGPNSTLLGNATVESFSYIGAGAIISNKVRVGTGSTISAGAVVFSDVPPMSLVVGNPALKLGSNEAVR